MTKLEFADIAKRLQDLAEAYDRRPLGGGAVAAWWQTLESLPAHDVHVILDSWLRTASKFPAPADIYRMANERGIDRREENAANEKAVISREYQFMGATLQGRRALKLIRDLIAAKVAQPDDPRAWARKILDRYADGEAVNYTALQFASEALGVEVEAVRKSRDAARHALEELA